MDIYQVPYVYDKKKTATGLPIRVTVPGSKSITNRALLLATLAQGETRLSGVLFSDDSRHFLSCVQELGFETTVDEAGRSVKISGRGGALPKEECSLYVGSAGTAARFLAAVLGVSEGTWHLDASEQMRRRPMAPLLASLQELGCEIEYPEDGREGFFPFTLKGHGFGSDSIGINIDSSSQFLSALLIASVLSERDFTTKVIGSHGMAYIEMTLAMMEQFGVRVERAAGSETAFLTRADAAYTGRTYEVEADASAAAYFYAAGLLLGLPVCVKGIHEESLQGDVGFLKVLAEMGATLEDTADGIVLTPEMPGHFRGGEFNLSACSDQAITLAAIAPFADGPVTISGIGHIRLQESDRLLAMHTELTRMGIRSEMTDTSLTIYPGSPKAASVQTYEDHRMAMGFALTGLRAEGIAIEDPGCCRKTFENYFEVLGEFLAQCYEL